METVVAAIVNPDVMGNTDGSNAPAMVTMIGEHGSEAVVRGVNTQGPGVTLHQRRRSGQT